MVDKRVFFPAARREVKPRFGRVRKGDLESSPGSHLPENSDGHALEDFTQRTAEAWGVGQSKDDNGVVLFVFPKSRYAHRGRLRARGSAAGRHYKRIIENEMLPFFRAGDFNAGISRGVNAILQATRGEYRGSGRTNADAGEQGEGTWFLFLCFSSFCS